jgi:hypothetical protein
MAQTVPAQLCEVKSAVRRYDIMSYAVYITPPEGRGVANMSCFQDILLFAGRALG